MNSIKSRDHGTKHLTQEDIRIRREAYIQSGYSAQKAAKMLGIARRSMDRFLSDYARDLKHGERPPVVLQPEEEHRLSRQNAELQRQVKEMTERLVEEQNLRELLERAATPKVKPLRIKKGRGNRTVSATAFLSDTHFDEVVNPAEVGGVNEYNREIAKQRLENFASKTLLTAFDLMGGFDVVHLDLPFGGDMVSGNIHEELARSNQAEIMDTVDYWSEELAKVVKTLASDFPSVYIPCVVGNHGRNTRKPRHKGRVRDNFDWLIYRTVARIIAADRDIDNVEFAISESTDQYWERFDSKYLLTHGDQASGGAGWGGIFSPIMRLNDKKLKAYAGRDMAYDYLIMGHWHRFTDMGSIIVNGSTKGYDEFAHNLNFPVEPPQQAFWLTAPHKGKIMSCPLFVDEAAKSEVKVA